MEAQKRVTIVNRIFLEYLSEKTPANRTEAPKVYEYRGPVSNANCVLLKFGIAMLMLYFALAVKFPL